MRDVFERVTKRKNALRGFLRPTVTEMRNRNNRLPQLGAKNGGNKWRHELRHLRGVLRKIEPSPVDHLVRRP